MSGKTYREEDFEEHIVEHLTSAGYTQRLPADYDRELCLIPGEFIAFVRDTQPDQYDRLRNQYGAATDRNIVTRLANEIVRHGAIKVLRKGIKDRGEIIRPVYFRPSSGLNPAHSVLYAANRLNVVRQVMYSKKTTDELDLVLFVNGIPIVTAELKNSLTGQMVEQAVKQYRTDRDPKEPLLSFKRCLVHFAVGNEKVFMTTRLEGQPTRFLPFNRDTENPPNPRGHATAYLWEDIWSRDSILDLIRNYVQIQNAEEKVYDPGSGRVVVREHEEMLFPRFHQLDAVRALLAAARTEGAGRNYLVQHSAGSGKSNSIGWLAHGLRQLYRTDTDPERLFDTIVVVTDRRVLDRQLQKTIAQFEQTSGTVVPITENSAQLKEALEQGKDIVVTTLQKFPVISETMTRLGGKHFAVIIDEAHSSQSGESAKHVKATLSAGVDEAEQEESEAFDQEDAIVSEITMRGRQKHISFFAFTATPKNKTLELFGRKNAQGEFVAFHIYSMRQAIEEGFILDVLRNYTTFARYFKLVKSAQEDTEYERDKAIRALTSYVDLTGHAVETKTRIMLEHFLDVTADAIQGRGRAMLVTRSRLHAVRYYQAFRKEIQERQLPFKPLVAFSGTVVDSRSLADYTESKLNRLPPKVSIPDAFKLPEYRILIVAEKFQTGFDEPMLHTMWVDKKLGDVKAVQTLSRLNRSMRGKESTVVLDFVNDADEIREAFQKYYQTAVLESETDPNKLYDLENTLEGFDVYTRRDVLDFAEVFFDPSRPGELMQPILDRVVAQWRRVDAEEQREEFRSTLQAFIRLYGYVSQLIAFRDTDLERLYVFARNLNRKLPKREGAGLPQGITDAVDLDSFRIQQTYTGTIDLKEEDASIPGIPTSGGAVREPEKDYLSNIISVLNETYGLDLNEEDRISVEKIFSNIRTDSRIVAVMTGDNSRSNQRHRVNAITDEHITGFVNTSLELYKKLSDPQVNEAIKRRLFQQLREQFRGLEE